MSIRKCFLIFAIFFLFITEGLSQTEIQKSAQRILQASFKAEPSVPARGLIGLKNGKVIFVSVVGHLSTEKVIPFSKDTPFRIASNTKTYLAARYFQLFENNELAPTDTIDKLLDSDTLKGLFEAGYLVDQITLSQLLGHTAGLRDHATSDSYFQQILAQTGRQWTAKEQINLMLSLGKPLFEPGSAHKYSDTGYVLLGQILERKYRLQLSQVVMQGLSSKGAPTASTWWEFYQSSPETALPRSRQYLTGGDVSDWHPSVDLHGGGGLVSSLYEMALFTDMLFDNAFFDKAETLNAMTNASAVPAPEKYRFGLTVADVAGHTAIGHSGFWGTVSYYFPDFDITIAGVVTDQTGYKRMQSDIEKIVGVISASK
ncbi:MAG: serine hydrolase [Alteromonadaceae bacterium]|nr:serine hydrolase [Alteromonadaceae bacterium]